MMMGESVTLTLDPDRWYDADDPIARIDGARSHWLENMLLRAIVLRPVQSPPQALPVFNDVLDVARHALASGSQANFRDSMRLVIGCLTDLPGVYERWGLSYTQKDVLLEPFAFSIEYEILRGLANLNDDVFRSGQAEATRLLTQVATELVREGLRENASLLLEQGAALWRHQLNATSILQDNGLRLSVHEQIGRLCKETVSLQQHRVEDQNCTLKERSAVQAGLVSLFRQQVEILKLYIDRPDEEHFAEVWRYWAEWARHWEPQHQVDELELRTIAADAKQQREAARALESARVMLDTKRSLEAVRARLIFALGSWTLEQHRRQILSTKQWVRLIPRLAGDVSDAINVIQLLRSVCGEVTVEPLRSWQLNAWNNNSGGQPADDRMIARQWGVVLLLRAIEPASATVELDLGPYAAGLGTELITSIEEVAKNTDWEEAVGGELIARAQTARLAVERAMRREAGRADKALAQAPLDPARIERYIEGQRRIYAKGDYLRELMLSAGAVEQTESYDESECSVRSAILPKRPFVDIDGPKTVVDTPRTVNALVQQQLAAAYTALAEMAQPADGTGASGAVEAIEDLRRAGYEPDVILIPGDPFLRPLLSDHPDWHWTSDFMRETRYLATLHNVRVYDPGPVDATALIVCNLAASLRRIEQRRHGDASPMRVQIDPIDESRAAQLWDTGMRPAGLEGDQVAQLVALANGHVEMHIELDVEWKARADAACRRIELPPRDERRSVVSS